MGTDPLRGYEPPPLSQILDSADFAEDDDLDSDLFTDSEDDDEEDAED
jgi:hypothetical protein